MQILEKEIAKLAKARDVCVMVRKGESNANLGGMLCGLTDPPLTILGRKQANLLFSPLHRSLADFSGIYSSDLKRAAMFADIATGFTGEKIFKKDVRLRELNFGDVVVLYSGRRSALRFDERRRKEANQLHRLPSTER